MQKKEIFFVMAGNAVEYYCLTLYGFLALPLGAIFFPGEDTAYSIFLSYAVFAMGFVARPLGGIFFGYWGDKWGRKSALFYSIFLIVLPTFGIGLTPDYHSIGILAPFIVVLLRLLQGFCNGGESSISAIFLMEHLSRKKGTPLEKGEGLWGSLLCSSSMAGALVGTGLAAFFSQDFLPSWSWRVPFILALPAGIVVMFLRRGITETSDFIEVKKNPRIFQVPPLQQLIKEVPIFFAAIGINATGLVLFYISSVYFNEIIYKMLGLSYAATLMVNTVFLFMWMILFPFAGRLADHYSKYKLMLLASFLTFFMGGALTFLLQKSSVFMLVATQIGFIVTGVIFVAPLNALMPKVFEVGDRCRGFGLSMGLGAALFGGTTPLYISFLQRYTTYPEALYVGFIGLVGIVSLYGVRKRVASC